MSQQHRISNPRTGKGDLGLSEVISGYKIRKDSYVCSLQNELMFLKNYINKYKCKIEQKIVQQGIFCSEDAQESYFSDELEMLKEEGKDQLKDDHHFLRSYYCILDRITKSIIHVISASAYYKFQNEELQIKSYFVDILENEIKDLTKQKTKCPEFYVATDEVTIEGDIVATQARKVETHFWSAVFEIYNQHDKQDQRYENNPVVINIAEFLNMLSDFIFLYNRVVHLVFDLDSEYWNNTES